MILDTILDYITAYASAPGNKTALWLSLFLLFLVIYFIVIWFSDTSKSLAIVIAFVPVLVLDFTVSFGKYVFSLPLGYTYSMDKGVILCNLFDYIFNFGFFKSFGLETFNTVNGTVVLTGVQTVAVYAFALGDSILEFFILAYFFYQIWEHVITSVLASLVLVIAYTIKTNPLHELATTEATVSHIIYFLTHADPIQLLIVVGTALAGFALVVFLISTVTNLFISVGKSTVRPGLESSAWEYSMTGLAFGLAVAYSVVCILHPEYSWYTVLPLLIIYSIARGSLNDYAGGKREKREQRETIREAFREARR